MERNKVRAWVLRGTVYSLLVGDRAVPLSGTPLQMAMNAIGPQRCMSDLARSTRATLRVHLCACGMPNAAAQQLPEVFYGIRAGAARIECEDVGDPMSLARITLTVAGDCWITSEIPDDDPQPAHHTSSGRVSSRSASTCLAVEAFTGLSAAGSVLVNVVP